MGRWLILLICSTGMAACQRDIIDRPAQPLPLLQSCQANAGFCTAGNEQLRLSVSLGPGVAALKPFPVTLAMDADSRPDVKEITLVFSMQGMTMGQNRYRMIRQSDRVWSAKVTLPICTSGRSDWLADLDIESDEGRWSLEIPFVLHPQK